MTVAPSLLRSVDSNAKMRCMISDQELAWYEAQAVKLRTAGQRVKASIRKREILRWELGERLNLTYGFVAGRGPHAVGAMPSEDSQQISAIMEMSKTLLHYARVFHRECSDIPARDAWLDDHPLLSYQEAVKNRGDRNRERFRVQIGRSHPVYIGLTELYGVEAEEIWRWWVTNKARFTVIKEDWEKFQADRQGLGVSVLDRDSDSRT